MALLFAIKQKHDADETLEKLKTAAIKIDETVAQLPTRYIGAFPKNLGDITDLIGQARENLIIMTDFAAYGFYSDYGSFWQYEHAIHSGLQNKPGLNVKMYLYNEVLRKKVIEDEFGHLCLFTSKASKEALKLRDAYIAKKKRIDVTIHDEPSLYAFFLSDEQKVLWRFDELERCDCMEMDAAVPMFLWMIDDKECVFSFESRYEHGSYFSFRTQDGRLLEYFRQYVDLHGRSATKLKRQ